MGANEWRTADVFPPAQARTATMCLQWSKGSGRLADCAEKTDTVLTSFRSDPANPVLDPYDTYEPHDYRDLGKRSDVLIFESEPLTEAITIAGAVTADMQVSCDCRDFDLWVRLLDVYPDGRAINLMSPGGDAQRVSYRDESKGRQLIEPGKVYRVALEDLITANRFGVGHRIRVQISAAFSPYVARNLQTGEAETSASASAVATISIHHGDEHRSSIKLPVIR
jgi:putative CocE/NonD family hydrolase